MTSSVILNSTSHTDTQKKKKNPQTCQKSNDWLKRKNDYTKKLKSMALLQVVSHVLTNSFDLDINKLYIVPKKGFLRLQ